MTAAWPITLPQCPVLNGFSEQRQRNIVAFNPDVGPPKIRRRSSASAVLTSATFRLTTDELSDFDTFFIDTLKDGSLPFEWQHPINRLIYSWWIDSHEAPRIDRLTSSTFRITLNLLRFGHGLDISGAVFGGVGNLSIDMIQTHGPAATAAFQSDSFQSDAFQI